MTLQAVRGTNATLLNVADRLAAEFDDIAAGSVLRCFSRAVVLARRSGTPVESLPTVAEHAARRMLSRRGPDPVPSHDARGAWTDAANATAGPVGAS
jgi:hypothetical protein